MLNDIYNDSKKKKITLLILNIYVFLVGVGVPLVVRDRYFDILVFKYFYYSFCTITMLALLLIYALTVGRANTLKYYKEFKLKRVIQKLTIMDLAVILFLLIAIVSTMTSEYVYEAFWGNEGRLTGLFLMIWYVTSYFCVSKFWKFRKWYVDLFLAVGIIVCLFGITDYFKMDIFHFKIDLAPEERNIFTSTIGNINIYTAYVGMIIAMATVLFAMSDRRKVIVLYYVCMVIGFFAVIMGVSDNAYLSLGPLFTFLPLALYKKKGGIFRYFVVLSTFITVVQCIDWINNYFGNNVLGIDSAINLILKFEGLHYLVLASWTVILLWYFVKSNLLNLEKNYGVIFRNIWISLLISSFIILLYILYDCNINQNSAKYGGLKNYLLFNDDWGTHRGYIWRNGIEQFSKFSLWKKLVGYGPETFGLLIMRATANNPYKQLFDNAHNEYLHLLTTVGIAGLIAYLVFIGAYIKNCFSFKKANPYLIAMNFAVICYSTQAIVNLNTPIVTPVFWLLLGMGRAIMLECNEKNYLFYHGCD
jgi:hypothetical protein